MNDLKIVREARKALDKAMNPNQGIVGALCGPGPDKDALMGKALGLLIVLEHEMETRDRIAEEYARTENPFISALDEMDDE